MLSRRLLFCGAFLTVLFLPEAAPAYIGPGAGFAFVSTFFIVFAAFFLALLAILAWPFRRLMRLCSGRKRKPVPGIRRVVVLGLDGLDHALTERFMSEGILPNFSALRESGAFRPLATTVPAESPVAWSSFMTGCNPGKHRIYDFLVPDRRSMLPVLSSSSVKPPSRTLKLGRWRIPLSRPRLTAVRRSKTFWAVLGEHGVPNTVIRVPLTFPPEKHRGLLLSAMSVPDLKGSQGTYFYYSSDPADRRNLTSGMQLPLTVSGGAAHGIISGPENSLVEGGGEMTAPFKVLLPAGKGNDAELLLEKKRYLLPEGRHSGWIPVVFRAGLGVRVHGICRFLLLESGPRVRLYMTPLQIDPARPAIPISHPALYSVYLAKSRGPFATLGVAEDTSALNEGVIGEEAFLEQCDSIHREREEMFFDALEKTPHGALVCVFDITDRVQHMFFGRLDAVNNGPETGSGESRGDPIRGVYAKMDEMLGRVLRKIDDGTVFMVVSDHGFKPFEREVNLNSWLRAEGYLAVKEAGGEDDMLRSVDWSGTRAYAVGFGGIYLNLKGREAEGRVTPGGEAEVLTEEIRRKLGALCDPAGGQSAVREVFDRSEIYRGPYVGEAPDLIVGFRAGYRAAWRSVTGGVGGDVFSDNTRPWVGDHNMHPDEVPGVLFSSRKVNGRSLRIEDVAPTVLELLGVPVPAHIDGTSFAGIKRERTARPAER